MRKIIFLCWVLVYGGISISAQTDSLGIEKEGERVVVLHKVLSKQTLFSLARRYGTTVDAINKQNPSLTEGLRVGQVLKIPYGKALAADKNKVTHTVKSGETLFSLASKYGKSISEIKTLNDLASNSLSVGQVLVIEEKPISADTRETQTQQENTGDLSTETQGQPLVSQDSVQVLTTEEPKEEKIEVPDPSDELSSTPFREVIQEGIAELIDEEQETTKFLALHKTAPTGTVIKIRNTMNDLTVYVRVIGKLPETGDNQDVIIKINKRAYNQLKALDKRILVELSYFL